MTAKNQPAPALLLLSILARATTEIQQAIARLEQQFGPVVFLSEPLSFSWTAYYSSELGEDPIRVIMLLEKWLDTTQLPEIKRATGRLEIALSRPKQGRTVNIDPGLLSATQLVLASTKPRGHRIYLGQGIFGDLMLLFGKDGFTPLAWTYPDYATPPILPLCNHLRQLILEKVKLQRCS